MTTRISRFRLGENLVSALHYRDSFFDCWHGNLSQITLRGLRQILAAFEKELQFVIKAQALAIDTDFFEAFSERLKCISNLIEFRRREFTFNPVKKTIHAVLPL